MKEICLKIACFLALICLDLGGNMTGEYVGTILAVYLIFSAAFGFFDAIDEEIEKDWRRKW